MEYRLNQGEGATLKIRAKESYSVNYLKFLPGERYEFKASAGDKWVDLIVPTNADGFNNWILRDRDKRVPGQKCFKLCGTIGDNEEDHFPIGLEYTWETTSTGRLYFFANESKLRNRRGKFKYYGNNWGSLDLSIKRIE